MKKTFEVNGVSYTFFFATLEGLAVLAHTWNDGTKLIQKWAQLAPKLPQNEAEAAECLEACSWETVSEKVDLIEL
jgi:hypothetical protein